jgi:hypothetical protein
MPALAWTVLHQGVDLSPVANMNDHDAVDVGAATQGRGDHISADASGASGDGRE